MEEYNYAALADERNQEILRRIKDNDPSFDRLWICSMNYGVFHPSFNGDKDRSYIITGDDIEQLGWLGYYIGQNTSLRELYFTTISISIHQIYGVKLYKGLNHNKSIQVIAFADSDLLNGQIFGILDQFFTNNNLTEIRVMYCELGMEGARQLSFALRCGNDLSLKLRGNTTKQLRTLNLCRNNIDDEGVEVLVHVLSSCNQLQEMNLSWNRSITKRGWKKVSTLLEMPDSNLEEIDLSRNNINDEGALIFVNSLRSNCKLKILDLADNDGITVDGWMHFSKLLCDTSSVNNTYLSNHTLEGVGNRRRLMRDAGVRSNLTLNRSSEDKGLIAMIKILQHHEHFNLQPFFEWEFKVLPLLIGWLKKASTGTTAFWLAKNKSLDTIFLFLSKIRRMKLSCLYEFVREFPMLYVGPVTRKEIEESSATEMQLLLEDDTIQNSPQLEEVQQRKTRAMRRLN